MTLGIFPVLKIQKTAEIFTKFDKNLLSSYMKTEFTIYKGGIKFLDNQIQIRDGIYKWHKTMSTVYAVVAVLFGAYEAYRYLTTHHIWYLLLGLAIIVLGIAGLITGLKVSTDTFFDAGQVEKSVVSKDFVSYLNLTLYLKNSQKRKVQLDYRDEDRFEKFYLNELIETLKSFSIDTAVK
jgi:hypothetical protein